MASNNRRQTLSAILGAAALAAASTVLAPAAAWAFPERPITLIVPWNAGGSTDQTARALSAAAERILGQPIVILNRGGASTTIGMTELAGAEPDGYTLGTLSSSTYLAPLTGLDVSFDMMESFDFVSYYGDNLIGIAVRADSPYESVEDLLEAGRANPGRITYGTAGPNTTQNLMTNLMMERSGAQFTMVPYRGSAEAMPALLGGQVDFITEVSVWAPFVESGEVRLLAINQPDRVAAYPDVPTLDELGFQALRSVQAIIAPAGLPEEVRATLEAAFMEAAADERFLDVMAGLRMQVVVMDGAETRETISTQIDALVEALEGQ